ncbi:single-strand selective monofunctional uracil DNA glycosylase isoform X2 [Python bivittatus]|uniref:Single-strand selective monofunctional uracil DNA glycosylase isoform X2 n=1 Tax=Python bivittatus TaxID=176946 RepID=A0A9F5IIE1_PYTBI|nr:single-strand selective monofunctional uracil DNA glycosylase isoform X2 [Python bivittatus]
MNSCEAPINFLEEGGLAEQFLHIEREQVVRLNSLSFLEPVQYVYNPLDYAWELHQDYVRKYCCSRKEVLFLGMNPGPFGMAQTGVPFGAVQLVRDWLQVSGQVSRPACEHPKRPIHGLECPRMEVQAVQLLSWIWNEILCMYLFIYLAIYTAGISIKSRCVSMEFGNLDDPSRSNFVISCYAAKPINKSSSVTALSPPSYFMILTEHQW